MGRPITPDVTSQTTYVRFLDSTTFLPVTGLVYNTAGLKLYYIRNKEAAVSITLATLASASAAYSSGGFKEVDATNTPGVYRLDIPNAALVTGTDDVTISGTGTGIVLQANVLHPLNYLSSANVQTECEDALIAKGLDHLVSAAVTGTDVVDNSIIAKLVSKSATADFDDFVNTDDSLQANRDNIGTNGAALTIAAVTGAVGSINGETLSDLFTTQMTESYAADGTAPTLAQALFLIQQSIGDFSISGSTITIKKLDGLATAATYTLDSATTPTSRTRDT